MSNDDDDDNENDGVFSRIDGKTNAASTRSFAPLFMFFCWRKRLGARERRAARPRAPQTPPSVQRYMRERGNQKRARVHHEMKNKTFF